MTTEAPNVLAQPNPDTSVLPSRIHGRPPHRARHLRSGAPRPKDAQLLRDDPPVADLVARARDGDVQAWDALVERYAPLIWSICRNTGSVPPLPRTSPRASGCTWWTTWARSASRPRWPGGSPPTWRECGRLVHAAHGPHAAAPARQEADRGLVQRREREAYR